MTFDQLVNQILKEALVSSIPAVQTKEKQVPVSQPPVKKVSEIDQTQQQQTTPVAGTPAQPKQEPEKTQDSTAVEDLTKQMADAAKKEEERSKKEHDDFAKLIATLTATQRAQQPTTAQTPQTPQAPTTNIPNVQQIIAGLQNIGKTAV